MTDIGHNESGIFIYTRASTVIIDHRKCSFVFIKEPNPVQMRDGNLQNNSAYRKI